ncbi:MAG: tRNA preQ1(34) S-adenosylmethionine ribosyltransferase-isomerase QueA, partial [Peptococcaceae bacterium]|nr:tRNA preQ1(34) S-adenosylmethionine ribosyltransferase-isomerase QueA [Peptococcaceae bacterium]
MDINDFYYDLPEELIAQEPIQKRDTSRLLVMGINDGNLEHRSFTDLLDYLKPGDALIVNETKVIPARLLGVKEGGGAQVEVLLLKPLSSNRWEALVKPGKKLQIGAKIQFGAGLLSAVVLEKTEFAGRVLEFSFAGEFEEILDRIGSMPTPPYIKKPLEDQRRYQTVYARQAGSAAAPTAGLHFSQELLDQVSNKGVSVVPVLLHVGLGTFRPVQAEDIRDHHMHEEYYEITPWAA